MAAGFAPMGSCVQKPAAGPSRLQKHVPEQWTVALQVPRQTPKALGDVTNWRAETIPAEKTVSKVTANMSFLTIDDNLLVSLRKGKITRLATDWLQTDDRVGNNINSGAGWSAFGLPKPWGAALRRDVATAGARTGCRLYAWITTRRKRCRPLSQL